MRHFSLLFCTLIVLLWAPAASAKDLRSRLAVGFENPAAVLTAGTTLPASLSLKYTLPADDKTVNMQLQALVGAAYASSAPLQLHAGARFLYTLVAEDNCNVYVGLGAAYVLPGDFANQGMLRAQPLLGVEFFLFGLENLGLSASVMLNIDLAPGAVSVNTSTTSLGNVGVHYYF